MERTFCVRNKFGDRYGRYATAESAWEEAKRLDAGHAEFAPHTVVELVPVPRPVGPRPVADIGGSIGCFFQRERLFDSSGSTVTFGHYTNITAAADLWQRHQQWLAAGGVDDA